MYTFELIMNRVDDDYDDVCYCIDERSKLEGETENMGVCTKYVFSFSPFFAAKQGKDFSSPLFSSSWMRPLPL